MLIVGIDPGKGGGVAMLSEQGDAAAIRMPATERDLLLLLRGCSAERARVFVEKVNAGPKMGSAAAFKFGRNVGQIVMAVMACDLPLEMITPQKWQRELGLIVQGRGLGQGDTEKKNRNKARAQELFPALTITHAIADALLIAEYGRRACVRMCQDASLTDSSATEPTEPA